MNALLKELFTDIRKDPKIMDPGLDSYLELLGLLRSGELTIRDFDDLVFVLEACWLKAEEQRPHFRELIAQRKAGIAALLADFNQDLAAIAPAPQPPKPGDGGDAHPPDPLKDGHSASHSTDKTDAEETEEDVITEEMSTTYHFALQVPKSKNAESWVIQGDLPDKSFLFTNDYLPVANRQLRQAWRTLQLDSPGGNTERIDFVRTINFSAKQGFFSDLFYHKEKVNQLKLLLFIDTGSDMLAEEQMGEELLLSARESFMGTSVIPLYFQDTPEYLPEKKDWIFYDRDGSDRVFLKKLCFDLPKRNAAALVFSEAGAFRSRDSDTKRNDTVQFVHALHERMRSVVWINPAPKERWTNPLCADLAGLSGLFDSSRSDIEKAIASLKGKQVLKTTIRHAAR